MTQPLQRSIYSNVAKRGYLDRWTHSQFLRRQLVKLLEETSEAFLAADWPPQFNRLKELVTLVKAEAKRVFDDRLFWTDVGGRTPEAVRSELADVQVVLCCAACAYEDERRVSFHLMYEAVSKSNGDIKRGVR